MKMMNKFCALMLSVALCAGMAAPAFAYGGEPVEEVEQRKQYQKLFRLDNVELAIEPEAIRAVAKKALERKTGARGLRSILEGVMTDIMYEIPSRSDVAKCIITQQTIEEDTQPELILKQPGIVEKTGESAS